jgi:argininosuccinate lyase
VSGPTPPEGYLGATGRVRSGPAPELVDAGYRLELADAPLLDRGLGFADIAHVLGASEQGTIPAADARALLGALLELQDEDVSERDIDPRYGDLANARERLLEQRTGAAAGWLNAGRPRREAGRIAFRIALRGRLLDLTEATLRFADALVALAARERDTLMPDYTYLQVAQPTTAGHWLLSFAYPALRDAERLRSDFDWTNRSPAGAGGVNGSRFPADRRRLAALLGFSGPIAHTRDALWQTDGLPDVAWHAAVAATGASRFADDLERYGSDEFGLLRIGDELCRASALMPHKRNPYALVVIRGAAGTLLGRAAGVLASQQTPSGSTDNLLYAYGEICGAVELAARTLRLAAATAESVVIDRAAAARAVRPGVAQATDLAEQLSRSAGIDYRSAYRVVGRAVAAGAETPDSAALDAAARELLGRSLDLDPALVRRALDPQEALATRTVAGGAAPEPMDEMLRDCHAELARTRAWQAAQRAAIAAAESELAALARAFV